jgi:hypothetical protein
MARSKHYDFDTLVTYTRGECAQLLRQGDAKVFKKYSQMKLQMKREALAKLNRHANEGGLSFGTVEGLSGPGPGC